MKVGSLCSGYGGLDLAVEEVFGARTVWHAEIDPSASKVLKARWDVPNHGDLTLIDWAGVEPVDILTAGWPCQPWSLAGKQLGAGDARAIWPEIARAVRELRPRYVCLENVSAVVVLGELARAAGDLAEARYDAQWTCLSASEVGAPHKRERFFIVASDTESGGWANGSECSSAAGLHVGAVPGAGSGDHARGTPAGISRLGGTAAELADGIDLLPTPRTTDANGVGEHGTGGIDLRTAISLLPTPTAADSQGSSGRPSQQDRRPGLNAMCPTVSSQWGKYAGAIERWEQITRPAPAPTEPNTKGNPRLSARFAEWMMGLPAGWVTDVDLPRSAHLKILGNGVVPAQAAAALSWLLSLEVVA